MDIHSSSFGTLETRNKRENGSKNQGAYNSLVRNTKGRAAISGDGIDEESNRSISWPS